MSEIGLERILRSWLKYAAGWREERERESNSSKGEEEEEEGESPAQSLPSSGSLALATVGGARRELRPRLP